MDSNDRKDKSVDFFLPFVNAGGSRAFSRERTVSMIKVLAWDGEKYRFGKWLSEEENPLGLTLHGLKYNEERGVASLVSLFFSADLEV